MSGFETRAIHVGQQPDKASGAVVPPISISTTFAQPEVGTFVAGYDYSRAGNPTRTSFEQALASLENAGHGAAFASGLAAADAALRTLRPGDHLVIPHDAYGGTFRLINTIHVNAGIEWSAADIGDAESLAAAWRPNTKMLWVETPTNPALSIVDIAAAAGFAHERNALLVVDNTFATPYLQLPLDLGADVVLHSTTKYIGGHSDVIGGFLATNNSELAENFAFQQKASGAVPSPFDCYLALRGLKTLAVRMERHCDNAEAVIELLDSHPAVSKVLYPTHDAHPRSDVARKQMSRGGGMVSFLAAGGLESALEIVKHTELFTLAESLGGVESLIEHPGQMTHASVAGSQLEVDDSLVRISVGIETDEDLVADLRQALDAAN